MIGNADLRRESKEAKYERLKKILREFSYAPPTGHGKVFFEVEFYDHDIKLVTPTTEIETEDQEIVKVKVSTKNSPNERKNNERG